jgi:hypothetical protein
MHPITNLVGTVSAHHRPVVVDLIGLADEAFQNGDREMCFAAIDAIYAQLDCFCPNADALDQVG